MPQRLDRNGCGMPTLTNRRERESDASAFNPIADDLCSMVAVHIGATPARELGARRHAGLEFGRFGDNRCAVERT